jgi:hypothetical protein
MSQQLFMKARLEISRSKFDEYSIWKSTEAQDQDGVPCYDKTRRLLTLALIPIAQSRVQGG